MAKFYGLVEGNRGAATRTGGNSGMLTSNQSWDGSVIVRMRYDNNDELQVTIGTSDNSECYTDYNSKTFVGSFNEFKEALALIDDIRNGRKIVVENKED